MLPSRCPIREFPAALAAGDSWAWTAELSGAVATGSTLVYTFRGPGTLSVAGVRASDGLSFAFSAATAATAPLLRGTYQFLARLTVGATATTIRTGTLLVRPNLADPSAEVRSAAEVSLADAEAALAAIAKNPNSSYTTSSGTFTKQNLAALRAEVDRLRVIVQRERGQGGGVTIRTAFGPRCGFGWNRERY